MITYLLRFMAGLVTFHAAEPTRIGNRWHFADGRTLPVISGGDGPLSTLQEQAARLTELRGEILTLADTEGDLPEADAARYANLTTEFEELRAAHDADFVRAAEYAQSLDAVRNFNAGQYESGDSLRDRGVPAFIDRTESPYSEDYAKRHGVRDAALKAIEVSDEMDERGKGAAEAKVRKAATRDMRGADLYILTHSSPEYASGVFKAMLGRFAEMTAEENAALIRAKDCERGMSLTDSAGGYLIPTFLDPSVIWTTDGATNPFRQISTVKTITGDNWNGVTSGGITMSWDTELAVVSDDTPTFGAPSITPYKLQGFVPISFEGYEDIQGAGAEIAAEFAQARDEKEAAAFATGSGSSQPYGIVTALTGVAGSWTSCATNSTLAAADLFKAQEHTGPRYRSRASWVMNLAIQNKVRALGSSDNFYAQTVQLGQGVGSALLGRPVYESSAMDSAVNTTTNNIAVHGDFSQYYIVDRLGTMIEFIPNLFDPTTGRPTGQRGWLTHSRVGADSVNDAAFTMLVNTNTAFV